MCVFLLVFRLAGALAYKNPFPKLIQRDNLFSSITSQRGREREIDFFPLPLLARRRKYIAAF